MRRARLVAAITAAGCLVGAQAATAQTPPTLTGENLRGTSAPTVTVTCNPNGTSSGTFSVTGDATGPYPGTFTETGSFSFGPLGTVDVPPQGPAFTQFGEVTAFDARFTITSGTTTITGAKTLGLFISPAGAVGLTFTFGSCSEATTPAGTSTVVDVAANTTYDATIDQPDGRFTDHGGSEVTLQGGTNPDVNGTVIGPSFQETFVLSAGLVPVTPPPPPPPVCDENDQGNQNQNGNDQGCRNP